MVHVPTHMYKVLLATSSGANVPNRLTAFLMPNEPIRKTRPLTDYVVDISTLSRIVGVDFFPDLDLSTTEPLCVDAVCADEPDKDARIHSWRQFGLIKAAQTGAITIHKRLFSHMASCF